MSTEFVENFVLEKLYLIVEFYLTIMLIIVSNYYVNNRGFELVTNCAQIRIPDMKQLICVLYVIII